MNIKIEKQAIKDIEDIKNLINNHSFEDLEMLLNTCNNDGELFDFNYNTITGTIIKNDNIGLLQDSFEIWDDEKCLMLYQNITRRELNRLVDALD
jgi:hypothetical protein